VSVHTTALGFPGAALGTIDSVTAYLSVKPQYVLSYDGARRVPNWVSWELNKTWLGAVARQNDFRPDDTFPDEIPQATALRLRGQAAGTGAISAHPRIGRDRR